MCTVRVQYIYIHKKGLMLIGTVRDRAQLKNKLTILQFHRVVFFNLQKKNKQ
jgi:hypothetical protein